MPTNFYMYFVAALIPMVMGFIYYHPMIMGKLWQQATGLSDEDIQSGNMPMIFGVSYATAVLLAFGLTTIVIHQAGAFGMFGPDIFESGSQAQATFNQLMVEYGDNHRSFGHGFLHGFFTGLFVIFPIFTSNSLFERRSWKYILVNSLYWSLTIGVMGGLLCATLEWGPLA